MTLAQELLINSLSSNVAIAALRAIPTPVFIKDSDLRYIWINKAFEDLFSITLQDIAGKSDIELPEDKQMMPYSFNDANLFESDEVIESYETIFKNTAEARDIVLRKHSFEVDEEQRLLIGIIHDITEVFLAQRALERNKELLEEKFAELRYMANTDVLTDCLNRRALFTLAPKVLSKASTACVLVLDVDFFKEVNDTYGHEAGDVALKHFADIVKRQIRQIDVLARIGGEEFAVLMLDTDSKEVQKIAERIRKSVEVIPVEFKGQTIYMTVSIGGVTSDLTAREITLDYLLSQADKYLYQAKENGRNQVVMSD